MSQLLKRKVNFSRNNSYRTVLSNPRISATVNNITGQIHLTINIDPGDGEQQFRLDISREDAAKLEWAFEGADMRDKINTLSGVLS